MTGPMIFAYAMMGCIIGIVSPIFFSHVSWCPEDGRPALAFTFGLLWPLTVVTGVVYALWLAGRALGRSFTVLWRAWRPVQVPRATARERVR